MKTINSMKQFFLVLVGISPALGALILYSRLPSTVATHFSMNNEVNGTMSREMLIVTLFLFGLMPALLRIVRQIDPKRANYEQFSKAFEISRAGITLLLAVIGWMIVAYNLGLPIDMTRIVITIVGLFFAVMGNYMTQVRHNYMIGIRTPWTLANEEVWRKTHRLAGPLMMAGGIISVICSLFFGAAALVIFLIAIGAAAIIPMVYSYMLFTRQRVK
jgi:uncharacterized membrane protein